MARLRILRDFISGERYFQDPVTGMNYQRTSGALTWPWKDTPGSLVTLGEALGGQNRLGTSRHDVHKLMELQSDDPAELVDALYNMTHDWHIRHWATPLTDKRSHMLEDLNRELRSLRRQVIRYGDPQGWSGKGEGLLVFYHSFVQRRTMSEKTLFIGPGRCADELAALDFDDVQKSILETPGAAALCFALAELDFNRSLQVSRERFQDNGPADFLGGY